jgi:acetyl-CoA carboxylase biotin carboxyl carrier protein
MNEQALSVENIKELMSAMKKNQLGSLKLKHENFSLELESAAQVVAAAPIPMTEAYPAAASPSVSEDDGQTILGNVMRSPIVGTFYSSPAPDKPVFAKTGDKVTKGQVLFIIESMKLMNEVTSEFDGTITSILVTNAQPVEFGQPILVIE